MILDKLIFTLRKSNFWFFITKLCLFFLLVFILDFSIGNTLRYFYFKQESGLQYQATYAIEKTKEDLLIFGSSRACNHYMPTIFEEKLGLSSYNVGRYGSPVLYHLAVLKGVLKRYTPKIIILDLNLQEFEKIDDSYDVLSSLLPYYKTHPEMRSIILMRGKYERLKLLSNIYPFNSELLTIAIGNTEINKRRHDDVKGFIALRDNWKFPIKNYSFPQNYALDSKKINAYKTFINACKKQKIKLLIVCSPYLSKNRFKDSSIEIGKQIAKKENISFLDYSNYIPLINPNLYHDNPHLNVEGARMFSNLVADEVLKDR
ncbi:hypothetical protein A5893_11165 [Pedobacter psychrophilus]|uniref:Uncharacterized protein n=1 Tax=Pedobacter psychrophilus TaxID=1826909 RepID=A0A179DFD5_9SPHI|nr:hypothetical protein A5893_11165 [Pedobacter psychrophilus]